MNFDLNIVMPEVFDVAHIALAALAAFLLLILLVTVIVRVPRSSHRTPASVDMSDTEETSASEIHKPSSVQLKQMDGEGALHLLFIFQNEARLVDFIREDVAQFSDEEIGAAARVVHKGLRKAFDEHFTAVPVLAQEEGDSVCVEAGFQPQEIQLLGNVSGQGPFNGVLVHQGWRVTDVRLPKTVAGRDSHILASAQVEM